MNFSKNALFVALMVSAALNILILGAVGGMAMASLHHAPDAMPGPPPAGPGGSGFRFNPQSFLRALPETNRHKAMRMMRSAASQHRKLIHDVTRTRLEIFRLLNADPMDDAAIDKAFARLRALDAEEQALAQKMMVKILRELPPQTRRRAILAASHRHGKGARRHRPPTRP